ncbi:MAG: ankyrin repeat domain-containing protein [Planctomycetota bacterium]
MPDTNRLSNELCSPSSLGRVVHRRLLLGGAIATVAFSDRSMANPVNDGDEVSGPREAEWSRDYDAPSFKPSWKNPQVNRELAADFVIFAHSEMKQTKALLDRYPEVLNAAVDWGAGDYETALGGASHMGRRDIVELLLERGARPDLFTLAMLGELDAVKSLLTLQPKLIDAKGPHGFSLHFHAQVGGERSAKVLDYLQSVKEVLLRPVPFLNR